MKTFLHYTKEKELEEGFLSDLGREAASRTGKAAKRAITSVGNSALASGKKFAKKLPGRLLALAKGVGAGAVSALSATDGKMRDAVGAGIGAYKGERQRQADKFKGKVSVAQTKLDCQKSIRERQVEVTDLQLEISTAQRRISRLNPASDADEIDALKDRVKDAQEKIARLRGDEKDEMSIRYQQERCKQLNQAKTPEDIETAEGERIIARAKKI